MDKVTITLPRATVLRLRADALNQALTRLRATANTHGEQRDGSTDADVAKACRDYLAIYDGFKVDDHPTDPRELGANSYWDDH